VVTQLPAFSKDGQADYKNGPLALSLSFNDGFDFGVYNWISGAATYNLNRSSSFTFVAAGNAGKTNIATARAPLLQNNSEIYNLIYTCKSGPWIIQLYFSATHVPTNTSIGITSSASTFGGSVLADYSRRWVFPGRGSSISVRRAATICSTAPAAVRSRLQ
jgi:Putative beta-barrel porin-2, OmpL-like. bbp2